MVEIMEAPGWNVLKMPDRNIGKARPRKSVTGGKRGITKPVLNKRKKAQLEKWKS